MVGTLVSSETLVKNEELIKDQVLVLSKGYVEKVLKQDKKRLSDGAYQVKLNCLVRKAQVYGTLQKANVPTLKFDGASLFADVVSQLDHQTSSVAMIEKALKSFSSRLVSASVLEEKPSIVERKQNWTDVQISWRATVDVDAFFSTCAKLLDAAFSGAALSRSKKPVSFPVRDGKDYGILLAKCVSFDCGSSENVGCNSVAAVPVSPGKNWEIMFYHLDKRILSEMPRALPLMMVVAHFRDTSGRSVENVALTSLQFREL